MKQQSTHTITIHVTLYFVKNSICIVVFCVSSERLFVRSLHYVQPEAALRSQHKVVWIWHEWVWSSSAGTHFEVVYDSGQACLYLH